MTGIHSGLKRNSPADSCARRGTFHGRAADQVGRGSYRRGYFRDTAHGFLAWAVAAVIMAAALSFAAGSVARTIGSLAGAAAQGAGTAAAQSDEFDPTGYLVTAGPSSSAENRPATAATDNPSARHRTAT